MSELTPLMNQYFSIKEKFQDAILFFRMGDFYEMFGEDAKIASSILQIVLTSRDKNKESPIPMCGIPYFSVENYISKIIKAGYKVALCEQIEDPKDSKGIVQREVIKVITPGTYKPEQSKENTYIMSIYINQNITGYAVADISTGRLFVYETNSSIEDEIEKYEPKEILCPKSFKGNLRFQEILNKVYISYYDDWYFDYTEAYKTLLHYFKVTSLEGYGCEGLNIAIQSGGALITYLEETQKFLAFKKISSINPSQYMIIDATAKKNLEITRNLKDSSIEGSLLQIMDETLTPMGGRFLRNAITNPLLSIEEINLRLDTVDEIIKDYELKEQLRISMRRIQDIERLASKIISKSINARELIALKTSIDFLPDIKKTLISSKNIFLKETGTSIADFSELRDLIDSSIIEPAPLSLKDGGIIKNGYVNEIDKLRNLSFNTKDFIAKLEIEERKKTGISSLKVRFNRIFGYYIEISKPNLHLISKDYIRKQTLANCERFTTEDLKEYEAKIIGAEEKLKGLEFKIFQLIVEKLQKYTILLLDVSQKIGLLDFLVSLSVIAKKYHYTKPIISDNNVIEITEGRHPVIERLFAKSDYSNIGSEKFISNNVLLDTDENRLLIITGPNMAGKSTYMRQIALIVIMAQIGSFVPADKVKIGIVDRIFTRIGAADFITKGHSTFMVEMIETSNILNNATDKSLVLLDEVGRGTSTFDGISIAWAVAEYLAIDIKARTLFATHYYELTDIAFNVEGVKNYNISVKEWGDEIIFLHKIEPGSADKSYGMQVARLAGLPQTVIEKAKVMLNKLEKKGASLLIPKSIQMDLFWEGDEITKELLSVDLENLTPQKAFKKLLRLKRLAEGLK